MRIILAIGWQPLFTSLACIKINLLLRVTGRRKDGYHLLDSLVAFCELGDRLELSLNDRCDELVVEGTFCNEIGEDNIVRRTLKKFREATGWCQPVKIRLKKEIPVGAGLGGGSSDAATTLKLLTQIPDTPPLSRAEIFKIALDLGADVPACLLGKTSRMQGIGEKLRTLDPLPKLPILLVNPNLKIETKKVFEAFGGEYSPPINSNKLERPWSERQLKNLFQSKPQNDLYEAAASLVPEISEILTKLSTIQGVTSTGMSGSGATCFAIFHPKQKVKINEAMELLRETNWWYRLTYLKP